MLEIYIIDIITLGSDIQAHIFDMYNNWLFLKELSVKNDGQIRVAFFNFVKTTVNVCIHGKCRWRVQKETENGYLWMTINILK